jgi:hypothetical protein
MPDKPGGESVQPVDHPATVPDQRPRISFLLLADRAEVLIGKLYIMGGMITNFFITQEPAPVSFAIALAVEVPWNAANEKIDIAVTFEDSDGQEIARVAFGLTVGRPPNLRPGTTQVVPFALQQITLVLPKVGEYVARSLIDGAEDRRVPFTVVRLGK